MRRDGFLEERCGGGRGTIGVFMSASIFSLSQIAVSADGAAVRAIWVVALALVALAAIDRMKPATPRRPAVVRVDNKPTPLYREPENEQKWRSLAKLSGGAVVLGALIACIIGFMLAIALDVVGGLLQA
jgi:hypothetical protein